MTLTKKAATELARVTGGTPENLQTIARIDLPTSNRKPHYIGGSGEHGCLYDSCGVYHTRQQAVDGLAETFNLGRTRKAKLKRDGYLELNPGRYGADYCEITECHCAEPWTHDDMLTEDDWQD